MDVSTTPIGGLFQTAERFREIGQHRRALAALQRVITHPNGSENERQRAIDAMAIINQAIAPVSADAQRTRNRRAAKRQAASERNKQREQLAAIRNRLGLKPAAFCVTKQAQSKNAEQAAEQHAAFVRVCRAYAAQGLTPEQSAAFLKREPAMIRAALAEK